MPRLSKEERQSLLAQCSYRDDPEWGSATVRELLLDLDDAYAENARLRKALEWYASHDNWDSAGAARTVTRNDNGLDVRYDNGQRARAALARAGEVGL